MSTFLDLLDDAKDRVAGLVHSAQFLHAHPEHVRAMYPKRQAAMIKLVTAILTNVSFKFEGAFCRVLDGAARCMTVDEMVEFSKLPKRTVERCLEDLEKMGYIEVKRQFRQFTRGGLFVAASFRKFTDKFWEGLGLLEAFKRAVAWAKENSKVVLKRIVKFIPKTPTEAAKAAILRMIHGKGRRQRKTDGPVSAASLLNLPLRS